MAATREPTRKMEREMIRSTARARRILGALAICGLLACSGAAYAQQRDGPIDPEASVVNQETLLRQSPRIEGQILIPDKRESVLIQPAGREWRYFHEVILHWLGAIVIVGMLALLAAAYVILGRIRISAGRSGRKVPRFNGFERFVHWTTATSFIILGISGLNITFGKLLLRPLL